MHKKALLLSAYDAESHQHWQQVLTRGITEYQWTAIALPARHFFWRIRSNALSFALEYRERLNNGYDVLIATSMVDLATLRGLVPELARVPALVYFHENQFDYPLRDPTSEYRIHSAQFSSIVTAFCANRVLFNTDYNRRTFLSGTRKYIKRMPDGLPPTLPDDIERKSAVLPVPIDADSGIHCRGNLYKTTKDEGDNSVDLVWAHRWEFDKQPEVFFNALEKLYGMPGFRASGMNVRLHVMGQSFREVPDCFQRAKDRGIHNVITWGYQNREDYFRILANSDFAISTALHDFQGLGMIEAIHQGCIPVAPNRVAYQEYIPQEMLYDVGQPEEESAALAEKLYQLLRTRQLKDAGTPQPVPDVSGFLDERLIAQYQAEINALVENP